MWHTTKLASILGVLTTLFFVHVVMHQAQAANASLLLSPRNSTVTVGSSIEVTVQANSSTQGINASDGVIFYPANLITATTIHKRGTFNVWQTEPTINTDAGTITYAGGTIGGITGTKPLFSVVFKAKNPGLATIQFRSASLLAADGNGTNILSGTGSAIIQVNTPNPSLPRAPALTSATHPDQNSWYSNQNATIVWQNQSDITGIAVGIDQNQDGNATTEQAPTNTVSANNLADGVWYVHVRVKNSIGWSQTSTYAVHIDTTPPVITNLILPDTDETVQRHPYITFTVTDSPSGIARVIGIINDEPEFSLTPLHDNLYELPLQTPGKKHLTITALDKAGNKATTENEFLVTLSQNGSVRIQFIRSGFSLKLILLLVAIILLLLIILAILLIKLIKRKKDRNTKNLSEQDTSPPMYEVVPDDTED